MQGSRRLWSILVLSVFSFAPPAAATTRAVLYPGVARLNGSNGTAWRSDAVFHNPTAAPVTLELELLPRGTAAVAARASLPLAVGETRQIDNLMDFLGAADGAGMLRVTGDAIVWVRTFNEGTAGTFGQDVPGIDPDGGYAPGEQVVFPFATAPDIKTAFRSNLLLVNLEASPLTVTLRAGAVEKSTTVAAGAYAQLDNLGAFLGTSAGFAAVHASADGRWAGVVSTIDPVTGDPTTVRGLRPGAIGDHLFAGVASTGGNNGTAWRSEATLYNPSDAAVSATLSLIPRGGSSVAASTVLNLSPGETRRLADVYQSLGAASGAGALRVSGGVLAWVRTFNKGATGTFGQDLPPIDAASAVGASIPVALPFRSAATIQTDFRSNLVVENLEDHAITLSIRAGGVTRTTLVPGGAYAQVDNLGAFLGIPPGVATAWVQADGRWTGTVSTIDPFTGDPTTLRDDRSFLPPSSYELVDAALAAHTISTEQAVTYKVFADFADPRLPAALQGDDRNRRENTGTEEATAQFASLSAATRDLVGPFLVQPFYQGSWWDLKRAGAQGARAQAVSCRPWVTLCPLLTGDWEFHDGGHIRVWYLKANAGTDAPIAATLAGVADSDVWPRFAGTLGKTPLPDAGEGGSDLLDVVLSDGLSSHTYATTLPTAFTGCSGTPAFVTLNRSISDPDIRKAVLAHELFHAGQFAFASKQCTTSIKWLTESTADWFENLVYPTVDREHDDAPHYLNKPNISLDNADGDDLKPYGGYLFFYYLTAVRGTTPAVVGQIFALTVSMDALHAFRDGLKGAGAELDTSWPDFAVYALNGDAPYDAFRTKDRLSAQAKVIGPRSGSLGRPSASWELAPKSKLLLPRLSIQYYYYEFPDATASSVGFFNGLTRKLDRVTVADYGDAYSAPELSMPDQDQGGHVTGLVKINGSWTKEDWTSTPARTFCRDMKSDRIEALVVILSNASIDDISDVFPHGTYPPLLFASTVGCGPWDGDATLQYRWGDAVVESMSVTGLKLTPVTDGYWDENTPLFRAFVPTAGGFSWSAKGSDQSCSYSGGLSGTVANPLSAFHVLPWVVQGVGYRGIVSTLFWEWLMPQYVLHATCPDGSDVLPWNAGEFVLGSIPEYTWARVSPDGKSITINAASVPEHPGLTGTWHFHAKREP